jgi:hypothetical protein
MEEEAMGEETPVLCFLVNGQLMIFSDHTREEAMLANSDNYHAMKYVQKLLMAGKLPISGLIEVKRPDGRPVANFRKTSKPGKSAFVAQHPVQVSKESKSRQDCATATSLPNTNAARTQDRESAVASPSFAAGDDYLGDEQHFDLTQPPAPTKPKRKKPQAGESSRKRQQDRKPTVASPSFAAGDDYLGDEQHFDLTQPPAPTKPKRKKPQAGELSRKRQQDRKPTVARPLFAAGNDYLGDEQHFDLTQPPAPTKPNHKSTMLSKPQAGESSRKRQQDRNSGPVYDEPDHIYEDLNYGEEMGN